MARLQRQVVRFVRGLVVAVVISVVALSPRAVQAQTPETPVSSSVHVSQSGVSTPSRRVLAVPLPMLSRSGELPELTVQPSSRSSQGSGSHKVAAGIAGAMLGGLVGPPIGEWMNRNSRSSDPAMAGVCRMRPARPHPALRKCPLKSSMAAPTDGR